MDKLLNGQPNVFGIADDILIAGFDNVGRDHDETVDKVLEICRKADLKLNKDKCHSRCTSILFFGEGISQDGSGPDPIKLKALMDMPPLNVRKSSNNSLAWYTIHAGSYHQLQ